MAVIKKVRHHGNVRFRLSWYDATGMRHQRFFERRDDATAEQARAISDSRQKRRALVDPSCTVEAYIADYVPRYAALRRLKPGSLEALESRLKHHVLPLLGQRRVRTIGRAHVQQVLARHLGGGAARDS